MNKHKPWIETSYHGVITEDTDVVLLDPPLVALDKDAPVPYAGTLHSTGGGVVDPHREAQLQDVLMNRIKSCDVTVKGLKWASCALTAASQLVFIL